jgi:hypothetical protein
VFAIKLLDTRGRSYVVKVNIRTGGSFSCYIGGSLAVDYVNGGRSASRRVLLQVDVAVEVLRPEETVSVVHQCLVRGLPT